MEDVMYEKMHAYDGGVAINPKGEKTSNAKLKHMGEGPAYLADHGSQAYLKIVDGKASKDHNKIKRTMMLNNDQR